MNTSLSSLSRIGSSLLLALGALALAQAGCSEQKEPTAPQKPESSEDTIALVPVGQRSPYFLAVAEQLDLGGESFTYLDTEGFGAGVAELVRALVDVGMETNPMARGFLAEADPQAAVEALGIGGVMGYGQSAVRVGEGVYRNRSFIYTPEGPSGALSILGASQPFSGLEMAPADTDFFLEGTADPAQARQVAMAVVGAVGGPHAQTLLDGQLAQPLLDSGRAIDDLFTAGPMRITAIGQLSRDETVDPELLPDEMRDFLLPTAELFVRVENYGWLVEPIAANIEHNTMNDDVEIERAKGLTSVRFIDDSGNTTFILQGTPEGGPLVLFTSDTYREQILTGEGGLASSAEYKAATNGLPTEGSVMYYLSKNLFDNAQNLRTKAFEQMPQQARAGIIIWKMFYPILFVENVPQGYAKVTSVQPTGVLAVANWPFPESGGLLDSQNHVVMVGLLAAMAIPAFNKVRANAIEGTMDNDARQVAAATQQFFTMNRNATEVPVEVIVSDDWDTPKEVPVGDGETISVSESFMRSLSDGVIIVDETGAPVDSLYLDEGFYLYHPQIGVRAYTSEGKR